MLNIKLLKKKKFLKTLFVLVAISILFTGIVVLGFSNKKDVILNQCQEINNSKKETENSSLIVNDYYIIKFDETSYSPHSPISITNDNDFTSANGVVSGDGSHDNPYIIEGWNITTNNEPGIKIAYTTKFFIIQNCWITASSSFAIRLENNTNGIIKNNNLLKSPISVSLYFSSNNSICFNTITNNSQDGISLFYSNNNSIYSNVITDNDVYGIVLAYSSRNFIYSNIIKNNTNKGIFVGSSSNNTINLNVITSSTNCGIGLYNSFNNSICFNTAANNTGSGINLDYSSRNFIYSNIIKNNTYDGITIGYSSNINTIYLNNISNNERWGIQLFSCSNNIMNKNTITSNVEYGIYLSYSTINNVIFNNSFVKNALLYDSQAYDSGENNSFYLGITGNFWDDWSGTGVYAIEGGSFNFDPYPMHVDLDQDVDDSTLDPDNDGLTNLEEYQYSTDPLDSDTDGDGLTDGQEVNTYFTDPLDSDSDGDELTDGQEVNTYSTDPTNSDTDTDGLSDYC